MNKCCNCNDKCPQEQLASEIAKGRMYATDELIQCYKELQAYKDAEEQGLLLRLPCKVGDTVYALTPFCEICEEDLDFGYTCEKCSKDDFVSETKFDYEMIPMFGKTVFLTREEAEKALEDMKGKV